MIIYHIGILPASPKPPKNLYTPRVRGGIKITQPHAFFTRNYMRVAIQHMILGNVYAYEVPRSIIKMCGGFNVYDGASEIVITSKYFRYLKFLGKVMSESELIKRLSRVSASQWRVMYWKRGPGSEVYVDKSKGQTGTMKSNRTARRRMKRKENRKRCIS